MSGAIPTCPIVRLERQTRAPQHKEKERWASACVCLGACACVCLKIATGEVRAAHTPPACSKKTSLSVPWTEAALPAATPTEVKSQAARLTVRSADDADSQTLFHCRPPRVSNSFRAYQRGVGEQLDEYFEFPVVDDERQAKACPSLRFAETYPQSN